MASFINGEGNSFVWNIKIYAMVEFASISSHPRLSLKDSHIDG